MNNFLFRNVIKHTYYVSHNYKKYNITLTLMLFHTCET